jgi:hypothetical protein
MCVGPIFFNIMSCALFGTMITLWSFIHQWLYNTLFGPWPLLQFRNLFYTVGRDSLYEWSALRKAAACTGQHKHRINAYTDIHALSGLRTHDPSFRGSEDSLRHRLRYHCDRRLLCVPLVLMLKNFSFCPAPSVFMSFVWFSDGTEGHFR